MATYLPKKPRDLSEAEEVKEALGELYEWRPTSRDHPRLYEPHQFAEGVLSDPPDMTYLKHLLDLKDWHARRAEQKMRVVASRNTAQSVSALTKKVDAIQAQLNLIVGMLENINGAQL